MVNIYPVQYNPLTTDLQFYKNWSFAIEYAPSLVELASLTSDKDAYDVGEEVQFEIELENGGASQDVTVEATIQKYGEREVVAGLPIRTLSGLVGSASTSLQWDSSGAETGLYIVEVTLKDDLGNTLDNQAEIFQLGISSAQITGFEASPRIFDAGSPVDVSLEFKNTGTVGLEGTALVRIQNEAGEIVETLTQAVTDLAPGNSSTFDDVWQTSGTEDGRYTLVGYLLYDGKSTTVEQLWVGTEARIYLPLVSRGQ
jgi:hypothetical protein